MTYDELKKAYEMAMQKCSELESKNAEQEKKISNLKRESEDKDLRIEHLTELVLKRNKMLFGRKSEKGKYICDGQLAFEGLFNEAEAESDASAPEPTVEEITKKSKKTGKHRGRNAIRKNLIEKPVIFDIPEEQRICDVCGKPMTEFATKYLTSRIAVIPEQIYVIKYYQKVYKCKNCEKTGIQDHIVAAENKTPACIVPKGMADASLVADIMQRKFQLGEPLYRQEQYWKLRDIYLNRTVMANWVIMGAHWFVPLIKKFWEYAFKETVLNADETPIRVLKIDGKPTKKKGQMWIVCTGACASRKIALYTYRDSRSKVTAEELLGKYTGVVQTDGLQSYGSGDYENAGCWAHARRKFVDCIPEGVTDCPSAKIVALLDKAAKYERDAKEANYTEEQILEMRQNQVKPLLDQVYDIIHTLRPSKGNSLDAAVTYALNQKEKLYLFLDNPKVEMTNNLAERTVKPFVINRKNFLFCDTEKGADASAAVMSIIETAKRNQLDVYGYLLHLLTILPGWGENPTNAQIESVMPWGLALPPFCKQAYSQVQLALQDDIKLSTVNVTH
jgi:transposase